MLSNLDAFIAWFAGHRAQFGGFCASAGAIMVGAAQYYPSRHVEAAGAILTLIGSHLMAGGLFKSDQFHRDKRAVIETLVDRRRPEGGETLIPPRDLAKLAAKEKGER